MMQEVLYPGVDVQRYIQNAISKVKGKIAASTKWVFTEMEKFILKKILGTETEFQSGQARLERDTSTSPLAIVMPSFVSSET